MRTVEREMQSQLIDCSTTEFVKIMREASFDELIGMLNILRVDYATAEEALNDLKKIIQDREDRDEKPYYNEDEKGLFMDLSFLLYSIEERCTILVNELQRIDIEMATEELIAEEVEVVEQDYQPRV